MATLLIKCTSRCNSNCLYCEAIHTDRKNKDMSLDLLDLVFQRINDYLLGRPDEILTFTWHGGEPLLLGPQYFVDAYTIQEKRCPETKDRISHCMQSNLTLLDERYVEPLKRLGMDVLGTSYDFEPHIRGFSGSRDTVAYNKAFLRGVTIAEHYGIGWGFIYVVTKRSLDHPLDTFNMLANLHPGHGFNLNPVVIRNGISDDIAITPTEYADFLGEIFPFWFENRHRFANVEPFSNYVENIALGHRALGCVDSGRCHGNHLSINSDGGMSQCGCSEELGIADWGSIYDVPLEEGFSRSREAMSGRVAALAAGECKSCELFPICHGGCPMDSLAEHGDYNHRSSWCAARRRFIHKYFLPATGLTLETLRHEMQ